MERRRRVLVPGVFLAIVSAVMPWPLAAASQARRFYVSVTDSKGDPKAGITASDLVIQVNGKPAAVASVTPADEPVSIIVVTEGIGRDAISEIRRMMKAVVNGAMAIHPDSHVGLMIEDGAAAPRMHAVARDIPKLDAEIGRFFESSRNAPLLDSILVASQVLAFEPHARRVILAVTWGSGAEVDVRSTTKVSLAVRASGASLWALDLGGREGEVGVAEQRVLSDVTAISGGRQERTSVSSITPLTERILATVRGQYAVTLEDNLPPRAASPKVSAATKGLKILAPAWPAVK